VRIYLKGRFHRERPFRLEEIALPYKPMKPCKQQGCPNLTHNRYCEAHTKEESRRYERVGRDPNHGKHYGAAWNKIQKAFLAANPLCELCKQDGRLTPSELVHHKRKVRSAGTNDWDNLQALCSECHSRYHAQNGDYF